MTQEQLIEVTQSDRNAAAGYWKVSSIGTFDTQKRYKNGAADHSDIVQAFARHRIAAEALARGRMEGAKALEPFAKAAEVRLCADDDYWTDNKSIQGTDVASYITFGDLRRAAAIVKGLNDAD